MPDESDETSYPLSMRALALVGLVLVGTVMFILVDVASGGRLTACKDCTEEDAGA